MKTVTSINGKFVSYDKAKISVFDNSLLYAEGLFETLLAVDGRIIFFNEHYSRLRKGATLLGIKIPVRKEELRHWMEKTVKSHPDRVVKLRLTLTSGEAARWVGIQGEQQVILSASPHQIPVKPFKLFVSDFRVDQDSVFRRVKTISYAIHAAALNQARKAKCDDALLLNEKDNVAEVTSANIFWVKKGRIYTTPIESGCLEGITRKIVLTEVSKIGFKISEKNISLDNLLKMDEVFISSSLKLIIPIDRVKTKDRLYRIKTGMISSKLSEHFQKVIKIR